MHNKKETKYIKAAKPDLAIPLYESFVKSKKLWVKMVKTGKFGAIAVNLLTMALLQL